MKIVSSNKKANFNYFIDATYECGISLVGSEVKSIRVGNININESFVYIKNDEVYLKNAYIKPYNETGNFTPDATRDRKLLLNKNEILRLKQKTNEKGYTLVPINVYFQDGLVKIKIGIGKGKHLYDKKQTLKEKDILRESEQHFRK